VVTVFVCLVALRIYRVAWARAMVSNYTHLVLACFLGSVLGAAICYYLPTFPDGSVVTLSIGYALVSVFALVFIRIFRGIFRDMFYELDCQRLVGRKDVSRLLVYGAGLRYRAFRRELVRKTAANARIIVGILDDDPLLHGRFIGEKQVLGALEDAPDLINQYNVDTVVITCMISQEKLNAVREVLAPSGVRIVHFRFAENAVPASAGRGALASTREKSTKEDTTYGTV
jgi:FlaA1/EpsC-like NDP-sugar epimerase